MGVCGVEIKPTIIFLREGLISFFGRLNSESRPTVPFMR
jgi:hypothetical protein